MVEGKDLPGVVAPPPLIFLFFLLSGIAADWAFALALFTPDADQSPRWFGGVFATVLAILVMTLGVTNFRRAGTPVPTRVPTTALSQIAGALLTAAEAK